MGKSVFYNADGSLTSYSFACGKVQQCMFGAVQMWQEHGCYHILRRNAYGEFTRESTLSLTKARKIYKSFVRDARRELNEHNSRCLA